MVPLRVGRLSPVRVLVLIKTNEGGLWILPHIYSLRERGHEVAVCLPGGDGKLRRALDAEGVEVLESAFAFSFSPSVVTVRGLMALRRQLRQWAPDVLVYHLYASALAGRLAGLGLGARRVHMVPGPLYLDSALIARVEGILQGLDHHLVAGSEYTLRRYHQLVGLRAPNCSVVPYGVDTRRLVPADVSRRHRSREAMGLGESDFVVVMVAYVYEPKTMAGYTTGIKGHDTLIEAWDRFVPGKPDARLVIVGGGFDEPGEAYRQELMRRYPGRGIVWTGKVDDVPDRYAAADLSVSPSLSENHGAAVEAGAMGVPSIVSDAGGLPETVTPESGWVFPRGEVSSLAEALEAAYRAHHDGDLGVMGGAARAHMEQVMDSRPAAEAFSDVVEAQGPSSRPVVTVFTEARFTTGLTGVVSVDGANGDSQWSRYEALAEDLRVAGRTLAASGQTGGELVTTARLVALPSYRGLSGLLAQAPSLLRAVVDAVGRSDLVVLRVPGPISTLAAAVARVRGVPYAVEMVGDPQDVLQSGAAGALATRLAKASAMATRWVLRGASAARFVTRGVLQARYPVSPGVPALGIPNARIPATSMVRRARTAPAGVPVLIAVGSQETTYKGHDVAIQAVARLRQQGRQVRLVLVGGGRVHDDLRRLASTLGVDEVVDFRGALTRDEVAVALSEADILVHPSRTEGLPRVVLEGMAQGLPVVATPVGGVPELVDDRFLVAVDDPQSLADAVQAVLAPAVYGRQSQRSLDVVRAYTQDRVDADFTHWLHVLRHLRRR